MPEQIQENHAATVRESLSTNILASTAAYAGYVATRFFIPPFVIAHVSLEAYGLWSAAFILVSYIGISTMGLSGVYIKYVAEYAAKREFQKANQILSTGLFVSVPACLAIFTLIWGFWPAIDNWLRIAPALRSDAREVILLVVAVFLASLSFSAFRDALSGAQRSSLVQVIWVAGYLSETILIFVLVNSGRGIRGLAEAFLIRTLIEIALALVVCRRVLKWIHISPALFTREALGKLFSFGGVVQIQSLLAVVLNSIERLLAARLVGLQATGLLELSEKFPNTSAAVALSFASALIPAASYLRGGLSGSAEQLQTIQKLYLKGARYMNLTAAFVCGPLALMPAPLLDVWVGKRYAGAAYLMTIFTIASQANLLTGPGTSILKGIGLPYEEFRYNIPNIVALLILVPLSRFWLGQWTVLGIGTAVAASTVLAAGWFIGHANRAMQIPPGRYYRFVLAPGFVPYVVAALFAWPALYIESHFGRLPAAVALAGIALLYAALLVFVIGRLILEDGERLWFEAMFRQRLQRLFPHWNGRSHSHAVATGSDLG